MDKVETLRVLAVLKAAYPSLYREMDRRELDAIVELWTSSFPDEPEKLVATAVKALIVTDQKGFPPHIGAVKAMIYKLTHPQEMTEVEAWNLVCKAMRNCGYNAREEYNKLPPAVQRLVGSASQLRDWSLMDADRVNTVVASNFQRSYRARAEQERELQALPSDVRKLLGSAALLPALDPAN